MKRNTLNLFAIMGLIFALEACDNSSESPRADTAQPTNVNENAEGTTPENTATFSDATTSPETVDWDTNEVEVMVEVPDASVTADIDANTGGGAGFEVPDASVTGESDANAGGEVSVDIDAAIVAIEDEDATLTLTEDAIVEIIEEPSAEELRFLEMYEDEIGSYDTGTIDPLYDKLDAVPKEFLVGTWKGGVFEANAPNPQNWYGKRVYPDLTAEAWLTIAPDGGPGPNNVIMGGGGLATIREEEFRGKSSAVLVYSNQLVKDYFRKIRGDYNQRALGDILIGFSTFEDGYFHLTRTFL